ncbi:MAG: dTDP-4-dehydrorhamnose reductase [Nitrospiria bacterium]
MKVMITGAKGMLAQAFIKHMPADWNIAAFDKDALDITKREAVRVAVTAVKPEVIINCAAYTQVDTCEEAKARAFSVNGTGPGNMAEAANEAGAYLIHFSTDYVFDGTQHRPYKEEDPIRPINQYGASKWEGESQVRKHLQKHLIIRTQWLYGKGGDHFVKTLIDLAAKKKRLKVVDDQVGAPTWTEDLSKAAVQLIAEKATGTYHVVNGGHCTWYGFASRIAETAALSVEILPCSTAEFPRPAQRPGYSVLSTDKAAKVLGHALPPWEGALERYFHAE